MTEATEPAHTLVRGIPGGSDSKKICLQCRRPRFHPWVGKIPWRREWQPTPVFFPGEWHGQRSLAGYSQWSHQESDMTEQLSLTFSYKLKGSRFWLHLEGDSLMVGVSDNPIAWKSNQVLHCDQSSKPGWPPIKLAVERFYFG